MYNYLLQHLIRLSSLADAVSAQEWLTDRFSIQQHVSSVALSLGFPALSAAALFETADILSGAAPYRDQTVGRTSHTSTKSIVPDPSTNTERVIETGPLFRQCCSPYTIQAFIRNSEGTEALAIAECTRLLEMLVEWGRNQISTDELSGDSWRSHGPTVGRSEGGGFD